MGFEDNNDSPVIIITEENLAEMESSINFNKEKEKFTFPIITEEDIKKAEVFLSTSDDNFFEVVTFVKEILSKLVGKETFTITVLFATLLEIMDRATFSACVKAFEMEAIKRSNDLLKNK